MQTDIFYASQNDTIASIKDKIKNHETNRICLVLPTRHLLFSSAQFNILRSFCASLGLELALVTREYQTLQIAKHLKIQQFASVRRARKVTWYVYDESLEQESLESKRSNQPRKELTNLKSRAIKSKTQPKTSLFMRSLLIFSVLIAFILLAFYLIPSATIFLTPDKILQEMQVPLLNQEGENIIGNMVTIKETTIKVDTQVEIQTTGEIEIPKSTATGAIEFTNISNSIVQIPVGTTLYAVIDEQQILVETIAEATLLPEVGSTVQTDITASNPGKQGNLPANSITNIVGDLSFYASATNPLSTRGGANQSTQAPSKDDFTQLRAQALQELQILATQKFYANSPEGYEISNLTMLSTTEEFTPESQSAATELNLDIQAEYQIEYVANEDLNSAFTVALDAQLAPNYMPMPNSFHYEKISLNDKTYYNVNRISIQEFNIQSMATQLAGKTKTQAIQLLQAQLGPKSAPEIVFEPKFLNKIPLYRLPYLDLRIYFEMR